MIDRDTVMDYANNLFNIIMPKLEAVTREGNSSTIHQANQLHATITGYRRWAEREPDQLSIAVTYWEYLFTAEKWLVTLAKSNTSEPI